MRNPVFRVRLFVCKAYILWPASNRLKGLECLTAAFVECRSLNHEVIHQVGCVPHGWTLEQCSFQRHSLICLLRDDCCDEDESCWQSL